MDDLRKDIIELLSINCQGLKAREIARELNSDKKTINRILYAMKDIQLSVDEDYVWYINSGGFELPESNSYVYCYFNANPKGVRTGDCVIRSLATALNKPWKVVLRELTEYSIEYGYMVNCTELYEIYLEDNGWHKHAKPYKRNGDEYTCGEWCRRYKKTALAHAGEEHITYIKEGTIYDIWDCSGETMGDYWI